MAETDRFIAVGAMGWRSAFIEVRVGRVAAWNRDEMQERTWQYRKYERKIPYILSEFLLRDS